MEGALNFASAVFESIVIIAHCNSLVTAVSEIVGSAVVAVTHSAAVAVIAVFGTGTRSFALWVVLLVCALAMRVSSTGELQKSCGSLALSAAPHQKAVALVMPLVELAVAAVFVVSHAVIRFVANCWTVTVLVVRPPLAGYGCFLLVEAVDFLALSGRALAIQSVAVGGCDCLRFCFALVALILATAEKMPLQFVLSVH